MDKQRNFPINKNQKDVLIEFMKNNAELQSGRFSSEFTFKKAQKLWEEAAELLNSIAGGATKNWRQWRKTWQDLKKNVKQKAVQNKIHSNKTGGGGPNENILNTSDNTILDMISPVSIEGILSVKESDLEFAFEENNEASLEIRNDESDCLLDVNLGTHPMANLEEYPQNSSINAIFDHSYNLDVPLPTPSTSTKKVPPQRMTKAKRLERSVKLVQQLVSGMETKNHMTENYYQKKINYLDGRKEYERKKLNALENSNHINNEILKTLKSIDTKFGVCELVILSLLFNFSIVR